VAIKFLSKKATTIEVKASKEKLIAGSGYFAAHWLEVSSEKTNLHLWARSR
jgi:hypothetical protein